MPKPAMNDMLKKRMAATQQASELQVGDDKNNAFTTNISVSTSGNAVVGGTVTLTATVTNGLNENITSGSVTSYRGGASSGNEINTNAASVSNGSATYTINSLDWTPSETAYTITAVYTPATGSSQQSASGTTSLTVGQGQPSITAVAYKGENQTNEFTYGDTITIEGTVSVSSPVSANSLTANQVGLYLGENQLGNAVTVGSGGSFTLTYDTGDKGIPIGDYQTLTIKYGGSGNLTTGEATVTITLNKKQVSALVQGDITKTWDGDDDAAVSLSVSADDLVAGDSLTVTAPNTAYASTGVSDSIVIDFGTLTVAGAAADFYTVNAPTGVTGSITPAGASVGTAPAAVENLVYADSAQDLVSGGAASGGNLVYALGAETEATETYSQTVPQESNAGTYYVWYYVQGDSNHNDSDPACVTVSIAKKDISGANITLGTALIYNGDQQTQTITSVTVDGLTLTAGDYTIRSNTGTNVESYTLTVTGTGNFTGTAEQTWSIGKATQTPPTASTQTVTASSVTLNTVDAGQGETQYGYVIGANGAAESVANWGTNNSFSGLKAAAAYTFFVRYAGDSNHHAAVSSGLTLYTAHATPAGTEGYTIDYLNEQVSAAEGYEVKVGDGEWTSASTQITPGGSFQVRQAATANGAPESAANTVDVEARPDQPTGLTGSNETVAGRHDGSISGVADTMEYRRDDSDGWTGCTGNTITGLAPGTYLVRLKAVSGASFAGAEATVVIATGAERTYTLNVTAPTFAGVYTGYTQPAAQPLTITSTGNSDAAITSVTLTGDTSAFALNKTDGAAITAGSMDNTTYTIRPAAGRPGAPTRPPSPWPTMTAPRPRPR